ncbi:MAG: peptidoglycan-binding protein, partial [Gammaproteobacteria bacterium]|nr:peptidoglycan-binding protein [Gammaproteobacteria bacterium]
YKETSLEEGMMESSNGLQFQQIEKVGSDEVLGYPSTKYKTRFQDKEGKGAGHVWVTDGGVPIKMDMIYSNDDAKGVRLTMEFVELNMRDQDPAIFELPAGLKPMSLGGMTGIADMMKQGSDGSAAAPGASALSDALNQLSPEQKEALSGAGLGGLISGMGDPSQEKAAAGSAAGVAKQSPSMSRQLTTEDMTQSVQLHLQYLGIDPGNTSGEQSVDTQIAISEFQASKGMKITGEVSPQVLGALSAEVDKSQ